jgi:hypothetical protein
VGWVAIGVTAAVAGAVVYSIYKCAQSCDNVCPYPRTSDPEGEGLRNQWVKLCKWRCVKSFGEAAKLEGADNESDSSHPSDRNRRPLGGRAAGAFHTAINVDNCERDRVWRDREIASDAAVLSILVLALSAGVSVIMSANHHGPSRTQSVVKMLLVISVAAALMDIVAELLSSTYRQRGIWWLDVLLGLMALTHLSYQRSRAQGATIP